MGREILEERSILLRAADPDTIISSINETDQRLTKLGQIADSSEKLKNHFGFANQWSRIVATNRELRLRRMNYNETAKMYEQPTNSISSKHARHYFWICSFEQIPIRLCFPSQKRLTESPILKSLSP